MASFEDLYRMQIGGNNPLFNVQQMQARMPNWLSAPTPPSDNVASTRLLTEQLNRPSTMAMQQQRLDIEQKRASEAADIQMQTFQAQMAKQKREQQSTQDYADANPEFSAQILAGKDPTTFQREMLAAGGDVARHRELFGPSSAVTVLTGNQFATPPKGMVRVPDSGSSTGTKLVAESGAPKEKVSDSDKKNRSIARQNQQLGVELQAELTNPDGSPNKQAIASMKVRGTPLNKKLNLFAQNETYLKSGAAANEKEMELTKGAIEPGVFNVMFGDAPLAGIKRSTEYAKQRIDGTGGTGGKERKEGVTPSGRKYWVEP